MGIKIAEAMNVFAIIFLVVAILLVIYLIFEKDRNAKEQVAKIFKAFIIYPLILWIIAWLIS